MKEFKLLLLWFSVFGAIAQQDPHENQVTTDLDSAEKVEKYLQLSKSYSTSQIDSSFILTKKAEELAAKIKNDGIHSKIRVHKAGLYIMSGRFPEAEKLLIENVEAPSINAHTLGMTYLNLGSLFNYKEEFEKATINYIRASEIAASLNDSTLLGQAYSNIGVIHARLKNLPKAITYLNMAVNFVGNNKILRLQIVANLSEAYHDVNEIDKAIRLAHEAEELAKNYNAKSFLVVIHSNLCKFYLEKGNYNAAITYGKKALGTGQELNQNISDILNNLGHAYLKNGNSVQALRYLKRGLRSANGELKSRIYKNLALANEKSGNYKKALESIKKYVQVSDSIKASAQLEKVNELTEKHEDERKQRQIDLLSANDALNQSKLKEQRNFIWALAILAFSILLLGTLWFRNQKVNLLLETSRIKNKLLQTQLNPHFMFNALNSMQGFNYSGKKRKLSDYIDSFSKLMRSILESSDHDFIPVHDDANAIKEYLNLQQIGSEKEFSSNIMISEDIDPRMMLPPMFTQPFVENAVLHGIRESPKGVIDVSYEIVNDELIVTIKDNGGGLGQGPSHETKKLHRSMGREILNERARNLQKTFGYKCTIKTDSNESGTYVTLTFPIREKKLGIA